MKTPAFARLLLAFAVFAPSPAAACLHGATGLEQATIVIRGVRTDRLRATPEGGGRVVKVFVAAPGASITGTTLSAAQTQVFDALGERAASIASEGTRGMGGGAIQFAGSNITGRLISLTAAQYPDWNAVVAAGVPAPPARNLPYYDGWLRKVRAEGRMAYALLVDSPGQDVNLAVQVEYGPDATSRIVADRILETFSQDVPSIIYFQDVAAPALSAAVAAVSAPQPGGAGEPTRDYSTSAVLAPGFTGNADIRLRPLTPGETPNRQVVFMK